MNTLLSVTRRLVVSRFRRSVPAVVLSLACAGGAVAADLEVTVENIQQDGGRIMVGLFDSAEVFPHRVTLTQSVPAAGRDADGKLRVLFSGVTEGRYAVSAVHDRDGNAKLSTNLLGMPTEPYGFSGQGSSAFGPPAFKDVAILLGAGLTSIVISVK